MAITEGNRFFCHRIDNDIYIKCIGDNFINGLHELKADETVSPMNLIDSSSDKSIKIKEQIDIFKNPIMIAVSQNTYVIPEPMRTGTKVIQDGDGWEKIETTTFYRIMPNADSGTKPEIITQSTLTIPATYEDIEYFYVYKRTYDENLKEVIWFSGVFGICWKATDNFDDVAFPFVGSVSSTTDMNPLFIEYYFRTPGIGTEELQEILDPSTNRAQFGLFRGDGKYVDQYMENTWGKDGFVIYGDDDSIFLTYYGDNIFYMDWMSRSTYIRKNLYFRRGYPFLCFVVPPKKSAMISHHQFYAGSQQMDIEVFGFRVKGFYNGIKINENNMPIIYDPSQPPPATPPEVPIIKTLGSISRIEIDRNVTGDTSRQDFVWSLYNKTYDYVLTSQDGEFTVPTGGEFALEFVHASTPEVLRTCDSVNNIFYHYDTGITYVNKEDWYTKFIIEVGQGTGDPNSNTDAVVREPLYDIRYSEDAIIIDCLNADFVNECFPDNNFLTVYTDNDETFLYQSYREGTGLTYNTISSFTKINKDGTYPEGAEHFEYRTSKIYLSTQNSSAMIRDGYAGGEQLYEYIGLNKVYDSTHILPKAFNQYEKIYIRHYCIIGGKEFTLWDKEVCPNDNNILKVSTMPDVRTYQYRPVVGDPTSKEDLPKLLSTSDFRFGANGISFLYDFAGFDIGKRILNKATKEDSIQGVTSLDIVNDKLVANDKIIKFQGNSYQWDTFMEINYEKGKDGLYKMSTFFSLDTNDLQGTGQISMFYNTDKQINIYINYDTYEIEYNRTSYPLLMKGGFNVIGFFLEKDLDTGVIYYTMATSFFRTSFPDGEILSGSVRLFEFVPNNQYLAYQEQSVYLDNIILHEVRGVFLNQEYLFDGYSGDVNNEISKIIVFLNTHKGIQKYTDCLYPNIVEYNLPMIDPNIDSGLLLPCVGYDTGDYYYGSLNPQVESYIKRQESPSDEIVFESFILSDYPSISKENATKLGYGNRATAFVPINYGKFQKIHLINWYSTVHFSYGLRYIKSNEYYLGCTYYNGNYDKALSPERIEYMNNRRYETKDYDFKVFIQNNDVNTVVLPIIEIKKEITRPYEDTFYSYQIDEGDTLNSYDLMNTSKLHPESKTSIKKYIAMIVAENDFDDGRSRLYDIMKATNIDVSPQYQKYIYGDEIVELRYSKTVWLDQSTHLFGFEKLSVDSTNIAKLAKDTLGYTGEISLALFEFNEEERDSRKFMIKQPHGKFEYLRTVDEISMLVSEGNFKDKLINESSDLFKTTSSPCVIELKDEISNWGQFNPNRKYRISKNDAVYFFEGNKEDYILSYTGFVESIDIEDLDQTISLNLNNRRTLLLTKEIESIENIYTETIENVFKKALGVYYPREVRLSYQSAIHIDKNDLPKVKLFTLGDYKTYEDFFNAIGDIGVRFYFDTKENIVLDVTCCEKESLTEDLVCTIDDLNDILIDSLKLSINENMVYNSVTIDYENKFPMYNPDDFTDESGKIATITNKNSPYVDFENHIFMKDETNTYNFNLLTKDMTYADFDSSRMLFGSMAIIQDTYDNTVIQFNCKVADAVIKTNSNDMVKASIAPGFDYVYQAYLLGYKQWLYEFDYFKEENSYSVCINPNVLPIMYQWTTEGSSGVKDTGHKFALFPQDEKVLLVTLSEPESDEYSYSGFIDRMSEYLGEWTDISACNLELVDVQGKSPLKTNQPFLVNTCRIGTETREDGSETVVQYDFSNDNVSVLIERKSEDETESYDFRVTIKNTITQQKSPLLSISPTEIIEPVIIGVTKQVYKNIKVGYMLKLSKIYEGNTYHPQYYNYLAYKEKTYTVMAKTIDEQSGKYYITVDKSVTADRDLTGEYIKFDVYDNDDVILLNHFHIRGNPIIQTTERYIVENADSISYFGEKPYQISADIVGVSFLQTLVNYILNKCSGGYIDAYGKFQEDIKTSLPIMEFKTHKNYNLHIGSLFTMNIEYHNTEYGTAIFQVIEVNKRIGDVDQYRAVLYKAENIYTNLYTIDTSNSAKYRPISSTDPTLYISSDELRVEEIENMPQFDITPLDSVITEISNGEIIITCAEDFGTVDSSSIHTLKFDEQEVKGKLSPKTTKRRIVFIPTISSYNTPTLPTKCLLYIHVSQQTQDKMLTNVKASKITESDGIGGTKIKALYTTFTKPYEVLYVKAELYEYPSYSIGNEGDPGDQSYYDRSIASYDTNDSTVVFGEFTVSYYVDLYNGKDYYIRLIPYTTKGTFGTPVYILFQEDKVVIY